MNTTFKVICVFFMFFLSVFLGFFFFKGSVESPEISMIYKGQGELPNTIDYNFLHNVLIMGGNLALRNFIYAKGGDCEVVIPDANNVVEELDFTVSHLSDKGENGEFDVSAKLTVSGMFLSTTPRSQATEEIATVLRKGYKGLMDCHKDLSVNAPLLH